VTESKDIFSARERRILAALAATIIPGSDRFPAAGAQTVPTVEEYLSVIPQPLAQGFKSLLWLLELGCVPRRLRPFTRLGPAARLAELEAVAERSFASRQLLRVVAATTKVAHFHDRRIYDELGCPLLCEVPAQLEQPRWWQQVTAGSELGDDDELDCDVVIVGTGAGGAPLAKRLADRGLAVVMLEEGAFYTREHFTGDVIQMQRAMYRDLGGVMALGNVPVIIPLGRAVGGTTVINSGTALRPPDPVLRGWVTDFGLEDLSPERLGPYLDEVERFLEVAPTEDKYLGDTARLIAKGCDALGLAHAPLPRNASGCDGQARCCFGCPTDAKRSTNVSYVPAALQANAFLFTETRAEEVTLAAGRATGVRAVTRAGGQLTIRARATVLACGALLTPVMLLRQGLANHSGQVGRNLTIHPAMGAAGEFDKVTDAFTTVPQGYGIDELWREGLLFEGATATPELIAAATHDVGPRFMRFADVMDRLIFFGFAVKDTGRGRVRRGVGGRPLITYHLNARDQQELKRGADRLTRILFAAGARRVHLPIRGFERIEDQAQLDHLARAKVAARDFDISAYHPLGTTRMGATPRTSVVGPDHQCHDVGSLYVCDGGVIPSSLGANPQITLMALATRAGDRIAASLGA